MQGDVTNEKSIYTCYKKGIDCINIVMETGYRFALKDTQSPFMGRTWNIPQDLRTGLNLVPLHGENQRVV